MAPLAAVTLLAGCISFGPKVPSQLISLTPTAQAPVGDMATPAGATAVIVLDPAAERVIDVLRVPVRVSGATVAYLKDAVWIEKPARQFRGLVAETIRAKSRRMVLEGIEADPAGKLTLTGRLLDMGYDQSRGSVIVRFDAVLTQPGGAIRAKRFQAEVPSVPANAIAVAPALNQAANDVAAQVAAWVG